MTIEERISQFENKYGFGMNRYQYWQFVDMHRTGNDDDKRFVEELFTDLNYHTECKMIKKGDYVAAHHLWETD
jgi:hypothetical protein